MPHVHSQAALLARRLRAANRGFLKARVYSFQPIEAPSNIPRNYKAIPNSVSANAWISQPPELWADIAVSEKPEPASPVASSCGEALDPFSVFDPWADAARLLRQPNAATCSDRSLSPVGVSDHMSSTYADACEVPELTNYVTSLESLVAAQNETIGRLVRQIGSWQAPFEQAHGTSGSAYSAARGDTLRIDELQSQVCSLAVSLKDQVEAACRLDRLDAEIAELGAALGDFQAMCASIPDSVFTKLTPLISALDCKVSKVKQRVCVLESFPAKEVIESWLPSTPPSLGGDAPSSECPLESACVDEYPLGDYVRLVGLKTASLNGCIGTVSGPVESSGRVGVLLAGSSSPKSLKIENLTRYEYCADDRCDACLKNINLFAFPPCSCGCGSVSDLYDEIDQRNYVPGSSSSSIEPPTRANPAYAEVGFHV